jgi:GNAT superfamily N-acetyltransferase
MPATIRKLTPDEILTLTPQTFTLAPIFDNQQTYASQNGALLLAEVEGSPAGVAAINYTNPKVAVIDHFAVSPRFRSHGVGSRLMNAVLTNARAHNAPAIRAHIPPSCPDWRDFYKRFKFEYLDLAAKNTTSDTTPVELKI